MINVPHRPLSFVLVAATLALGACRTAGDGSQPKALENVVSSTRVGPGVFDVSCDDGTVERATADEIRDDRVCSGRVTIHRAYRSIPVGKTSFLYSLDQNEAGQIGYTYEGPVFRTYSKADHAGMVALIRCQRNDGVLFNSIDAACEGLGTGHGPIGFVYAAAAPHTTPIYRCTKGGGVGVASAVIMSTSQQDCQAQQFQVVGTIAHIAP